jgi:hypothetical protein
MADAHSSGVVVAHHLNAALWIARTAPLLAQQIRRLAPGGVYPASLVSKAAVRSYRTVSPLPMHASAVCFLWHFPSSRLDRPLACTIVLWSPDFPPEATSFQRASARCCRLLALPCDRGHHKASR